MNVLSCICTQLGGPDEPPAKGRCSLHESDDLDLGHVPHSGHSVVMVGHWNTTVMQVPGCERPTEFVPTFHRSDDITSCRVAERRLPMDDS